MKIGILISGRGSNMLAIAEAVKNGTIPSSEIAVVISDKRDAIGLEKAAELGLKTLVIERNSRPREAHDAEIIAQLQQLNVDIICLAGYMRLLSAEFIRAFPNRILNIHPSLLPSFKGLEAQRQAIEYGAKVSGCTVHFVDEELDHGAIILQTPVEISTQDTPETLSAKILEQEHLLYVTAIAKFVRDEIEITGRKVVEKQSEEIAVNNQGEDSQSLLQKLTNASKDLIYISETDANFEPFAWGKVESISTETILEKTGSKPNATIEEQSFEDFFARLTTVKDWFGASEKRDAQNFADLKAILETNLRNLKVFRIGHIQISIYVVGFDSDSNLFGVKTNAVET